MNSVADTIKDALKIRRNQIILGVILIVIGYFLYRGTGTTTAAVRYVTSPVEKGTITSSISGSGQVSATHQLDVKPLGSGGTITSINIKNGQEIKEGDVLAVVDQRSAEVQVLQAEAALAQAKASRDKLVAGAAAEDIAASKASLEGAQISLDNAKNTPGVTTAKVTLDNAKNSYDTVVKQQEQSVNSARTNMLNAGIEALQVGTLSTGTLTLSGTYTGTDEGQYAISVYAGGDGLYYSTSGLGGSSGAIARGSLQPLGNGLYVTFSTTGTFYVPGNWTIDVPNKKSSSYYSAYNSYQSALLSQTTALNQAQNSITSAQSSYDQALISAQTQIKSAESSFNQAVSAFNTKTQEADPADLLSANAQVKSAEAQLISAENNYSDTVIRAPFSGTIAQTSMQKGDVATSSTVIATLITKQQIAVISLNEVDVAKVKVGQKAMLTFDAVDELTMTGTVAEVDLIGAVTQNVVSYNVKIAMDIEDENIRPGMSVSASIITDVKQDTLIVPSSAVKSQGDAQYVEFLVSGAPVRHNIEVGLTNESEAEISGDIKEGDLVITQTIATSTVTKPATTSGGIPGLGGLTGGGTRGGR